MRLGLVGLAVAVGVGAAHGQRDRDDTGASKRSCGVTDCFLEREVRDFEVIDRTHLVVYVGPQRCAFHVELSGAFCDLTFAPDLYFRRTNEVPDVSAPGGDISPASNPRVDPFYALESSRRGRPDLKICGNDLTVQVHGGVFTESGADTGTDRFGYPRTDCQISSVDAITDDQLMEFYVSRGVAAPPPPMGTGEIEIGEQAGQGSAEPTESDRSDAEGR